MAEYLWCRQIHQVPIVCTFGIFEVEHKDVVTLMNGLDIVDKAFGSQSFEVPDEYQESAESYLVPPAGQQLGNLAQGYVLRCCFHDLARLRHLDAEELIAIAVFSRSRLEEAHQHPPLRFIV